MKRLSPFFVELTQDTLLKAFWYKASLRLFLQQHQIEDIMLAQWHADQSKREYVEWLFPRLLASDRGDEVILSVARSLAEMDVFPDLERREDTRIRIAEAQKAVSRLRKRVIEISEAVRETEDAKQRRRAAREELTKRLAAQQSVEKLLKQLEDLAVTLLGRQEGGYAFEKWFYDLAIFYELEARPSYWTSGRQIDGAVTIEGTTYLIETRFTREPVGSPDIDIFMGKIESKADNTMGLFVSISGFNAGAIAAASKPKTPMLLIDHSHLFGLIPRGVMSLPDVVLRIKRHASQTGAAHLPAEDF
jgi:restriction endonuclease Mrr